ncbi:MAG TPA: MFS transporter [Acidimicrobiales bacterium]
MPGSRRSRRDRQRTPLPPGFGAIWTTVAIDLIGFGIVLPLLPRYAEDLKITPTVIGFVVASFSVAQMIGSPILGRLSDRFGRKPILIFSLIGTAVGSLVTGLAGTVWLLLLGRIIDGSSGASVSVAQAAVADVAAPDQRPRLLGLLGAAFGVGFVIGPAIGALVALGGKRLPFLIAAVISGVNAIVAMRRLPETHPDRTGRADAAAPDRVGAPRVALPSRARRLILVAFLSLFAFSAFETTFALLLKDRFSLTLGSTGAVFAAIGLALVFVQAGLIHPVSGRLGEGGTLRAGLFCNAIGLALLAVDGRWLTLVPALLLLVFGQGFITPTMSSAVAGQTEPSQRGRVLGYQQSAGSLARAVGPAAAGILYSVGIPVPYVVGAVVVAIAVSLVPSSASSRAVPGPVAPSID